MKKYTISICHSMRPSIGGMSKQAILHKSMLEEIGLNVIEICTNALTPFKFSTLCKMFMNTDKFNFLHIHASSYWGFLPVFYGLLSKKIRGGKIVLTYHGGMFKDFYKRYKILIDPILNQIDYINVPTKFLENEFKKNGFEEVTLISTVVSRNFMINAISFQREKIQPIFLVTRSFEPIYNIMMAVKAFEIILKKYPDAKLLLVGNGSEKNRIKEYINLKKIRNIKFTGQINHRHIVKYYLFSSIYLNPTNEDNSPASILEAYASGLSVVSTNVGGLPFIIEEGKTGYLVSKNDFNSMALKSIKLLDGSYSFKRLITRQREFVKKHNSYSSVKKSVASLYTKIIDE